jgi:cytochrome c553
MMLADEGEPLRATGEGRSMKVFVGVLVLTVAQVMAMMPAAAQAPASASAPAAAAPPIPWAYPVNPPAGGGGGGGGGRAGGGGGGGAPPAPETHTLPGSDRTYTLAQVRNAFDVADWRPDLHPAMPDVVSKGRQPDVRACGFCHMPNGQGRPENASLAGQPAEYVVQQMMDFKNDLRVSSEPRMGPPRAMITVAKGANDQEIRAAAEYFASFPYRQWIRVVEAAEVPRTTIAGGMFVPVPEGGVEPIGNRILEVPENTERTELRDPASSFIAYVPPGSIEKGRVLVTTGGNKTAQCALCHGEGLKGQGAAPALAGRSPSYMARQLWDFKSGARKGANSQMMVGVVNPLTPDDILAIVAYTASLTP